MNILFVLTLIQFWWIAIWGLAYIMIDAVAGPSKIKEIYVYILMLGVTAAILHSNPDMLERL